VRACGIEEVRVLLERKPHLQDTHGPWLTWVYCLYRTLGYEGNECNDIFYFFPGTTEARSETVFR
jgi:hypothetical protein